MLQPNVADGVPRIEDSYTNWYLVEKNGRLTVIDAGVRTSWRSLLEALSRLGRTLGDIEAVVLTHAPFDHVGFQSARDGSSASPCTSTRTTFR